MAYPSSPNYTSTVTKTFTRYGSQTVTCRFNLASYYDPQANKTKVILNTTLSNELTGQYGWYGGVKLDGTARLTYNAVYPANVPGRTWTTEIANGDDGVPSKASYAITWQKGGDYKAEMGGLFGYYDDRTARKQAEGFNTSGASGTLYVYTPTFYTLTIDLGDGSSPTTEAHAPGYVKDLGTPTRYGYTFAGWSVTTGAGSVSGNDYTYGEGDATVTAQWTANPHTVTLTAGDHIASVSGGGTYHFGDSVTVSAVLDSATGYTFTFDGWYAGDTKVSSDQNYTFALDDADVSLTAEGIKTANTYTVHFNANTGTGSMSDQSYTYDTAQALTANAFTKTGYSFLGWSTNAAATTATYTDQQSVSNLTAEAGGEVTLYAIWSLNRYTLTITPTKSTVAVERTSSPIGGGTTGVLPSGSTLYHGDTLQITFASLTGYTVTTSTVNGVTISSGYTATVSGAVTVVITSTANTYSVSFDANGTGGAVDGVMTNQSFTYDVSGVLKANEFTRYVGASFVYNDGETYSGYETSTPFLGWATSPNGAVAYTNQQSVKNLTATQGAVVPLYAKWGSGLIILPTATRTGYTLKGWYTAASGGTRVGGAGDSVLISVNTNYYAQWEPTEYTLTVTKSTNGVTLNILRQSSPIGGAPNGLLSNNAKVYYGDVIRVSYAIAQGYQLLAATVNGVTFTSPLTLTNTGNLSVSVTVELGAILYIDGEPYQAFIDNGSSWEQYEAFIDNGSSWEAY